MTTQQQFPPQTSNTILDEDWRIGQRIKTVAGCLVLNLHLGVPPPDQRKPDPTSRLECWVDPMVGVLVPVQPVVNIAEDNASATSTVNVKKDSQRQQLVDELSWRQETNPQRVREVIGRTLQTQYEFWHPKAKYKLLLDCTTEDLRRTLQSMRRGAKAERLLLHYNGHGVPLPTQAGEAWLFNKTFTQYIPVHVRDLDAWMGRPAVYVLDVSCAGRLVNAFSSITDKSHDCMVLAACAAEEQLPTVPCLPADIFTCCLTTPIEMAIRWHLYKRNPAAVSFATIPGRLSDRRSPLGHLNWIFTAVTDAIAWQTLPLGVFRKYYREDLLVASLSRNYLLAVRIGRSLWLRPQSFPAQLCQGNAHLHPLWHAFDQAIDTALLSTTAANVGKPYEPCNFFIAQMQAFRLWIEEKRILREDHLCSLTRMPLTLSLSQVEREVEVVRCPFLPISLQVLLSQDYRKEALNLLLTFCDLGRAAVLGALHTGAHPYFAKLLQSSASDIRAPLTAIWLRLLVVDGEGAARAAMPWDDREFIKNDAQMYVAVSLASEMERMHADTTKPHSNPIGSCVAVTSSANGGTTGDNGSVADHWIDLRVTSMAMLTAVIRYAGIITNPVVRERIYAAVHDITKGKHHTAASRPDSWCRAWALLAMGCTIRQNRGCKFFLGEDAELRAVVLTWLRSDEHPRVRAMAAFTLGSTVLVPEGPPHESDEHVDYRLHPAVVRELEGALRDALSSEHSSLVRLHLVHAIASCTNNPWASHVPIAISNDPLIQPAIDAANAYLAAYSSRFDNDSSVDSMANENGGACTPNAASVAYFAQYPHFVLYEEAVEALTRHQHASRLKWLQENPSVYYTCYHDSPVYPHARSGTGKSPSSLLAKKAAYPPESRIQPEPLPPVALPAWNPSRRDMLEERLRLLPLFPRRMQVFVEQADWRAFLHAADLWLMVCSRTYFTFQLHGALVTLWTLLPNDEDGIQAKTAWHCNVAVQQMEWRCARYLLLTLADGSVRYWDFFQEQYVPSPKEDDGNVPQKVVSVSTERTNTPLLMHPAFPELTASFVGKASIEVHSPLGTYVLDIPDSGRTIDKVLWHPNELRLFVLLGGNLECWSLYERIF